MSQSKVMPCNELFYAMLFYVACHYYFTGQFIGVHHFIAPPGCKLNHRAFLFFFLLVAGHNNSAWPSYAKGQLSAFSLSLASLREQHVPLPWFPAYLSWQCLRLPHCYRTQTPLRHLFYNIALCPANQYYGRR